MVKTTCGHPESAIHCTEEGTCHCRLCEELERLRENPARFWDKVDKSGECWLWTGATSAGYGYFQLAGQGRVASRVSYQLKHGAIPAGKRVMHTCGNRNCVNPNHLALVDPPGHKALTGLRGRKNPNAKLNEEDAREIKQRLAGGETQSHLAEEFGVTQPAVSFLAQGKTWGWIDA